MSECVVRMEMPENCTCCPMCFTADVQGYHWCAALEQEVEEGLSRPKDCPITCSLPEGHGRLVDADALEDGWIWGETDRLGKCECVELWQIKTAPTIVPAEAERSET